jgi:hypothetical protein
MVYISVRIHVRIHVRIDDMNEQINIDEGKAEFVANVWINGNSKVITIPKYITEYLSIDKGTILKIKLVVID